MANEDFDPDFQTNSGSKLYVAAGRPATNTASAFASKTWILVGAVSNMGDVTGETSATATVADIGNGVNLQKKGSATRTTAEFQTALVENDPGQVMVRTFASARNFSINSYKVERQDGSLRYVTAQAQSPTETASGIDDAVMFGFSLLRQSDTVRVAAPAPADD
jgi:hypothetical protein